MAFTYTATKRIVSSTLKKLGVDLGSELEDLIQEVMLRQLENPGRPVRYIIIDYLRVNFVSRDGYGTSHLEIIDPSTYDTMTESQMLNQYDEQEIAQKSLELITDPVKNVALTMFLTGHNQREIADHMGYTEGGITLMLQSIFKRLRKIFLKNYH